MDVDEAGVKNDFSSNLADGFDGELGGTSQCLCGKVDHQVKVDMVGLDLVEVGERVGIVRHLESEVCGVRE